MLVQQKKYKHAFNGMNHLSHRRDKQAVPRGPSMIFGKGVHMFKGVGVRFADISLL